MYHSSSHFSSPSICIWYISFRAETEVQLKIVTGMKELSSPRGTFLCQRSNDSAPTEIESQDNSKPELGIQENYLPIYFFFSKVLPPTTPHWPFLTKFYKDSKNCFLCSPNPHLGLVRYKIACHRKQTCKTRSLPGTTRALWFTEGSPWAPPVWSAEPGWPGTPPYVAFLC